MALLIFALIMYAIGVIMLFSAGVLAFYFHGLHKYMKEQGLTECSLRNYYDYVSSKH